MRPIDADALKAHYAWWGETKSGKERKELFDEIVDLQPTVEVDRSDAGMADTVFDGRT